MNIEQTVLEGREDVLVVRYEDLLTDTEITLRQILDHISVPADSNLLSNLEGMVEPSRAYAFRDDENLVAFAERNSETLEMFGYGN